MAPPKQTTKGRPPRIPFGKQLRKMLFSKNKSRRRPQYEEEEQIGTFGIERRDEEMQEQFEDEQEDEEAAPPRKKQIGYRLINKASKSFTSATFDKIGRGVLRFVIYVVFATIPIFCFLFGLIEFEGCPLQPSLPLYAFLEGILLILGLLYRIFIYEVKPKRNSTLRYISTAWTGVFLLWQLCGCLLVLARQLEPPLAECDQVSFFITLFSAILFMVFFLGLIVIVCAVVYLPRLCSYAFDKP